MPATNAAMSSANTRRLRKLSGTSPLTMRSANPSTIAVLPTPASPISTGLFLVRRCRIWMARRISSSRPMIGIDLALLRTAGQVICVLLQRLAVLFGIRVRNRLVTLQLDNRLHQALGVHAALAQ